MPVVKDKLRILGQSHQVIIQRQIPIRTFNFFPLVSGKQLVESVDENIFIYLGQAIIKMD